MISFSRSCFNSWGSCRPVVRSFAERIVTQNAEAFYRHPKASWFDEIKSWKVEDLVQRPQRIWWFGGTPKRWLSKGIQFAQIDRWWFHSDFHFHFLPLITWEFMNPEILRAHILFKSGCKNKTPRSAILFDCIFSDGTESSRSIRTCYSSSFSLHKEQTKVRSRCGCKVKKNRRIITGRHFDM